MSKLLVANWKMNCNLKQGRQLVEYYAKHLNNTGVEVVVCPSFVHILPLKTIVPHLRFGAQNCSAFDNGAYTGEISAKMLTDIDCEYVILGHSERRQLFHDNELLTKKIEQAQETKLKIIFCVGENLNDYKRGSGREIIKKQLAAVKSTHNIIIAYEPVWAIGTGIIPNNEEIQQMVSFIKSNFTATCKVLYGGSVNDNNIAQLNAISNLDGYLIGGASLNAEKFINIAMQISKKIS